MRAFILAILLCSCGAQYTAQEQETVAVLEQQLTEAEQAEDTLRMKLESIEDEELRAEILLALDGLDAVQDQLETSLAGLEQTALDSQYGPIVTGLGSVHPLLGAFSPLLLGLVPLLGKRGRKHFGKAVMHVNPFSKEGDGKRRPAPLEAATSLLKMLGALHSEKDENLQE